MKKMRISQTGSVAVAIFVLTVVFLMPVTAPAGEADIQKPDIQKPDTLKGLLKKIEIAPNKPGAQINYLFKLEVPVELKKVHPSVNKAAVFCRVSSTNPDHSNFGQGMTEIHLQGGAYNGIVNVYITGLDHPDHKPELVDKWWCIMALDIDGYDNFLWPFAKPGQDPIGAVHKPGTLFQVVVEGSFD